MVYLMRLPAVMKALGLARATVYRHVGLGLLTPAVHTGPRSMAWPSNEVEAIVLARIAGWGDERVRELVAGLVATRNAPVRRAA